MARASRAGADRSGLLDQVLGQLAHGVSVFDADDQLLLSNRRYQEIWRLPDLLCRPGSRFADILAASHGAVVVEDRFEPAAQPGEPARRRREWQLDDGRRIQLLVTRLPEGGCVALHEDVTEQRAAQQRVAHLASHDVLTGLPNRGRLCEEITRQLARVDRGEELALLCLDLDRFKSINDTLGHGAGDLLLRQVAARLKAGVRGCDTVARLGGDEFVVLQVGVAQPAGATVLARRLIEALSQSFDLDGHQAHIGTGIGVAVAPFDGTDADTLLRCADLALYRAKRTGRGQLRYFEPEMDARLQQRRLLELDLRGAIARGEFALAYQAQVAMPGPHVVGAEALLRWNHPVRGRVSPADFVPLAEETGLIIPIGLWVLREACRAATAWPPTVRVAVNVSPVQFKSRTLVQDVLDALDSADLAPQRLELEITEAVLLDDTEHALSVLHALRERGIRISMDDFGTGYSSLSYLRRFPFDKIKIDRSFIAGAADGGESLAIVQAINSLGRSLRMTTTAEGVETPGQLAAVAAAGCTEIQGFLFSRPGPAEAIAVLAAQATVGPLAAGVPPPPAEERPCTNDSST